MLGTEVSEPGHVTMKVGSIDIGWPGAAHYLPCESPILTCDEELNNACAASLSTDEDPNPSRHFYNVGERR